MPNILFKEWVKNVNKLGTFGCYSCGLLSTKTTNQSNTINTEGVKPQTNQHVLLNQPTYFYTHMVNKFNLLNKSFTYFPHNLLIYPIKIN